MLSERAVVDICKVHYSVKIYCRQINLLFWFINETYVISSSLSQILGCENSRSHSWGRSKPFCILMHQSLLTPNQIYYQDWHYSDGRLAFFTSLVLFFSPSLWSTRIAAREVRKTKKNVQWKLSLCNGELSKELIALFYLEKIFVGVLNEHM